MHLWEAVLSGIGGTALMTLFVYAVSIITHKRLKVVKILGTMLTYQTTPDKGLSDSPLAIATGIIAHYAVGIIFALTFMLLWDFNIGQPTLPYGLVYGFICGTIGIGIWKIYLDVHSDPPAISVKPYLITILIGHIVFGAGVIATYKILEIWV